MSNVRDPNGDAVRHQGLANANARLQQFEAGNYNLNEPRTVAHGAFSDLDAALDRVLPEMNVESIALEDVISFLRDITCVNYHVSWEVLEAAGVDRCTPITLHLKNVTLRTVLALMLEDAGYGARPLNYQIVENVIRISTGPPAPTRSAESKGATWQKVQEAAAKHCQQNPFPGVNALAKIVGCAASTMSKAIDRSNELRAKLVEHEAQRKSVSAVAMTDAAAASAKQTREPSPIDAASASTDDLFLRLLDQCESTDERIRLQQLTPAERRKLVATIEHDPD